MDSIASNFETKDNKESKGIYLNRLFKRMLRLLTMFSESALLSHSYPALFTSRFNCCNTHYVGLRWKITAGPKCGC